MKSRRVMEKIGFVYHHKTEKIELKELNEIRTGHVMVLTRTMWEENQNNKLSENSYI